MTTTRSTSRTTKRPLVILLVLSLLGSTMIPAFADDSKVYPLAGDFNGDGVTTPGWFVDGVFVLYGAADNGDTVRFRYGRAGDVPVVGDWNGDKRDTVGVVRNGRRWLLRDSNTGGYADRAFVYGGWLGQDRPVVGDWTGKGYDAPGVVRGSTWHLRTTLSAGDANITFAYGRRGDTPITGAWADNGRDTAGIVRDGVWHLRKSNSSGPADWAFRYGRPGDVPVAGSWDGRGGETPGVVRGTTWMLKNTLSGGSADVVLDLADPAVDGAVAEAEVTATRKPTRQPVAPPQRAAPPKAEPEPDQELEPVDAPSTDVGETVGALTRTSIGSPRPAGTLREQGGAYTLSGAGADIWQSSDSFEFAHQPVEGDVSMVVRVTSQTDTHDWAKAGLMMRADTTAGSPHVSLFLTPANGIALQYREAAAGTTTHIGGPVVGAPTWLRLDRRGDVVKAYNSKDGLTWALVGSVTVAMAAVVIAGLAVTSNEDGTLSTAEFADLDARSTSDADQATPGTGESETSPTAQESDSDGARLLYAPNDVERHRSQMTGAGPYFSSGDAGHGGAYSPGDGARSVQFANDFLANPQASYWIQEGLPLSSGDPWPSSDAYVRPMHAAWIYMTQSDHPERDALKQEVKALLLHHASHPSHDFSNSSNYPVDYPGYSPSPIFGHAHWMTRLIKARDMLGRDNFTSSENAVLDRWFYDYANWGFKWLHNEAYVKVLPGRENRDYSRINVEPNASRPSYDGGPLIGSLARAYTNRHAAIASTASLAANYLEFHDYTAPSSGGPAYGRFSVDKLLLHSRLFVEESIRFSVFPQGFQGDFERGSSSRPQTGWLYSSNVLANLVEIAEYHAKRGDMSVWNYGTSQGFDGTAGVPVAGNFTEKNLHFYAWAMSRYVNNGWGRTNYGEPLALPHFYHDVIPAAVVARFAGDDGLVRDAWRRSGSAFPPYPRGPQSQGRWDAWLGEGAKSVGLIEHGGATPLG